MQRQDIEHLAKLARIALTDRETDALAHDITNILVYVSEVSKITGDVDTGRRVGAVYNVLREDAEPHEAELYTEALLNTTPEREGRYVKVKKILGDT